MILRNRRFNIQREVAPEKPHEELDQAAVEEQKREENVELINSIDYLLRNDVEGGESPESQFGENIAKSSFDDDGSVSGGSVDLDGSDE